MRKCSQLSRLLFEIEILSGKCFFSAVKESDELEGIIGYAILQKGEKGNFSQYEKLSIDNNNCALSMSLLSKIFCCFIRKPQPDPSTSQTTIPVSSSAPIIKPQSNSVKQNNPVVQRNIVPISSNITIQIRLINSSITTAIVDRNMTGEQLKNYIYAHVSQELNANSMSIYYEGVKITKNMKLSSLNIVVGTQLKIIQSKADIAEVSAVIANANGIDPLTDEVGTARMSCGHHIGKDSMTMLIRSLISSNKYEIRCPSIDQDGQPCLALWDFSICKKVGVLTKSEVVEFENGLTLNWIKENAKECPNCKHSISKYKLGNNRVICPKCKFGDFCYLCLNKWKGPNNQFCGNQECKFLNDFVSQSPWNRKFTLIDKSDGNKKKEYTTPQYRACVHCMTIIEHIEACKHMPCKCCKKSFCWVCLSTNKNGSWPCGAYNEYCGKTAQVQRFDQVLPIK